MTAYLFRVCGYCLSSTKGKKIMNEMVSCSISLMKHQAILYDKDLMQTTSRCHFCGQEPFGCSTVWLETSLDLQVYRYTDGCSLKGWLLWKRSGTPAAGFPTQVQQPEENPFVFSSCSLLLLWHIPPSSTSAFRCLW